MIQLGSYWKFREKHDPIFKLVKIGSRINSFKIVDRIPGKERWGILNDDKYGFYSHEIANKLEPVCPLKVRRGG